MRAETNRERVTQFMESLGKVVSDSGRIYFTGGVSAVLMGWRNMTVDVDLKADPEPAGFFEALPQLKDKLDINLELACPSDFIPELPGWRERGLFIARHGKLDFYHYDFYSQALAKIERFNDRDRGDVEHMLDEGSGERGTRLWELFQTIRPVLIRYPAIDPATVIGGESAVHHSTNQLQNHERRRFSRCVGSPGCPGVCPGRDHGSILGERKCSSAALLEIAVSTQLAFSRTACACHSPKAAFRRRNPVLPPLGNAIHGVDAYSQYNAHLRRLSSLCRALEGRMRRRANKNSEAKPL